MAAKKWRTAKSLDVLLKQVNERWPKRSKVSDGSIGDIAHANRKSDHNPNAAGVVMARDFTHDPKNGPDARSLAEALIASHDLRIKYIISNREIASGEGGPSPWQWRPYTGVNAHRKHVHVSVNDLGDVSTKLWDLSAYGKPQGKPQAGTKPDVVLVEGTKPDETQVVIVKTPQNEPAKHPLPNNAAGYTAFGAMIAALGYGLAKYFGGT